MSIEQKITIVGRFDPSDVAHLRLSDAILHAETALGIVISTKWVVPADLDRLDDAFAGSRAAIIAPQSNRTVLETTPEILDAVSWLRLHHIPTLGIESGFWHMAIEWARNVIGRKDAEIAAFRDDTSMPVFHRFLAEPHATLEDVRMRTVDVEFLGGSKLATVYGRTSAKESIRPLYAFNADFAPDFERSGVSGSAHATVAGRKIFAAFESSALDFHVGVAYLPQMTSSPDSPHPLLLGLIRTLGGGFLDRRIE